MKNIIGRNVLHVLGQSRVFFVMARNREIPSFLSCVHPRRGTPSTRSFSGAVMLTLVLMLGISGLAMLTCLLVLSTHALTNLATLKLYFSLQGTDPPFKAPRPLHAVAGFLLSFSLTLSAGLEAMADKLKIMVGSPRGMQALPRLLEI